ncbi:diguanylate cyclase [Marinobacterium sp. AK62]|uniref:Diguanylate cyclase n=1 Tax=Marinobacterium alkalitolerans TaxID=1542925 RepID=A0ABS3ZD11_9GAMM|nr:diguanylate cyclase [Marinobacterium alkalitolerans]MBP0049582.1 diguanylate cyclase [Marinobacterium alkalitolerans]
MPSSSETASDCLASILDHIDCTELLHSLDGGVLLLNRRCQIVFCNRWISQHIGLGDDELIGKTLAQLYPGQIAPALQEAIENACLYRMGRILSYQLHKRLLPLRQRTPSGELRPLHQSILIRPLSESDLTLIQVHDITNAVKREQHLRASERVLRLERKVLELIATGDSMDDVLTEICTTIETLLPSVHSAILLLDEDGKSLSVRCAPSLPPAFMKREKGLRVGPGGTTCTQSIQHRALTITPDIGSDELWRPFAEEAKRMNIAACWAQPIVAAYDEVLGVLACYPECPSSPSDADKLLLQRMANLTAITLERHKRIERIRFLAMHDPLTGLPNRSLLNELLGRNLRRAHREGNRFALMFIDLDGFKEINDHHGHDAGDDLLSVLSGRMTDQLRGTDTCARIGGDEFVIMLETVHSPESAQLVAEKILTKLNSPVQRGPLCLQVSASIGIALYPDHGVSADALLTHADDAMYKAKAEGKNCWQLANPNGQ